MYTLINGSPKKHSSNSMHFLNLIKENLETYALFELEYHKYEKILKSIKKSNAIVLSFPLYVDSPPSSVLEFLDYIIDHKIYLDDKLIYIIINCGFREGTQNKTAINIIKRWCAKTNAVYACSIQIGAGEIIGKEKFKFISRKALKKLKNFSIIISTLQKQDDITTTIDLINNKLYCLLANMSWNKKGKKNKLSKTDLKLK